MRCIINAVMISCRFVMPVLCFILLQGCDSGKTKPQNHRGAENTYDFRKSRWGDSIDEVKSREYSDLTLEFGESTDSSWLMYKTTLKDILTKNESLLKPKVSPEEFVDAIIYNSALESIPVTLTYTFDEENRLESADYMSELPIDGVRLLTEYAMELHGEPTRQSISSGSMSWHLNRSMILLMTGKSDRGWHIVWSYSSNE